MAHPIFSKNRVNFTPTAPISHLAVANSQVVIAMTNKVLIKIDLKNPEQPKEIDLNSHGIDAKLVNMFLDPSGTHLFLTFSPKDAANPAEVYYLNLTSSKPKEVPGLKSHIITAVGWGQESLLLGSSKGSIFEAEVNDWKVKHVYDIGTGSPAVISGLEYFLVSGMIIVLVATAKRLYQFQGREGSSFSGIFTAYISQNSQEYYKEFGPGVKAYSEASTCRLHVHYIPGTSVPATIAYLTDAGVMVYSSLFPLTDSDYLGALKLISLKSTYKSVLATDYHVLLLQKSQLLAVCILNDELIFEDNYPESLGTLSRLIRSNNAVWTFTDKHIFKYGINSEDRNIWSIFLEKQDFIKASEFAGHDPVKMEEIARRQAEVCFAAGEYEMSAQYYAMTCASFEEIALKFIQIDSSVALKTFLMKKMGSLRGNELGKTTALVLWLIEIFLNDLGGLRDFGKGDSVEYRVLDEEFLQFMAQPMVKECVGKNKKAVCDLMASHGDHQNLVHFTLLMKDYGEVIESNINNGRYSEALSTLLKQKDASLYSRFIPILLDKDPSATIDALIQAGRMLSPIKLLPKFSAKLDGGIATQVTRYLEHCIDNLRLQESSLHDYLVSLYIHFYPEKLMGYLESQATIRYDPKTALMGCIEKELALPCVHLFTLMGHYEAAVGLSLSFDLALAKKTASEANTELKRKLWLQIAQHVVKEKNDIQQAMEFLQECELLKIEDILPFFPEFETIDHFKDAICASLADYNGHIQSLKSEMDEANRAAEVISEEIHSVRNRCAVIRATDSCTVCENSLLVRNFYVFPCGHKFHADCLVGEIYPGLSLVKKRSLAELQRKLAENSGDKKLKADIDEILASECAFCGDFLLKLIDVPFVEEEDYARVQREWE